MVGVDVSGAVKGEDTDGLDGPKTWECVRS